MSYDPQEKYEEKGKSIFGIIIHSFFVVPFLIAVFGVLLFAAVRILTMEKQTASDLLDDVKTGGLSKRWQSAFELSKILGDAKTPHDDKFDAELIKAFQEAEHDDNRVRQYLAFAMGRTGEEKFVDPLLDGLKNEKEENVYSLIYSLGVLKSKKAANTISAYLENPDPKIRLVTVMALGNIGAPESKELLKKSLHDQEPNVQWDSAIALAKIGDNSGKEILLNLLDRGYLSKYKEVDIQEQTHVLLVAIEAAGTLSDPQLKDRIKYLAQNDSNMNVRKLALKTTAN